MENYRNTELGTHRSRRSPVALEPSYVVLDDTRPMDLLEDAMALAKKLRFVKAEGIDGLDWETVLENAHDDWSGFLGDTKGPLFAEFKRFFENPTAYQPADGQPLSQPHVALFVAFLHILQHASTELNAFTRRHLDHYLLEILQLKPRPAQPAEAFVTFELSPDAASTILPKGMRLLTEGADVFETSGDLELNAAKIAQVSALRAVFQPAGFRAMLDPEAPEGGMRQIRELIWDNGPGRRIQAHGWDSFAAILEDMDDREKRKDFPDEILQISLDEFRRMMALPPKAHPENPANSANSDFVKWEALHARMVIADAYPNEQPKSILDSKNLKDKLAASLFNGGTLPDYKGKDVDLQRIYADATRPESPADAIAALAYIRNILFLEEAEFHTLYDLDQSKQGLTKLPSSIQEATIRKAASLSPHLLRKQVAKIAANDDARILHRNITGTSNGWFPYGKVPEAMDGTGLETYGLLIESPVLAMVEGDRTLTLTLDLAPANFEVLEDLFDLSAPDHRDWYAPFMFNVSGEKGWLPADWRATKPKLLPATQQVVFTLAIPASLPAVTGPGEKFPDPNLVGKGPLLNIRLTPARTAAQQTFCQTLQILKIGLLVSVKGITEFQAQNQLGDLKISSPFEPFGNSPEPSSEFMLAHPEISLKQLESLDVHLEWMGLPEDVKAYYDPYFQKMGDSPAITNIPHARADFKASPELVRGRWAAKLATADIPFLETALHLDPTDTEPLEETYTAAQVAKWKTPTDWPRYVRFEYASGWSPQQEFEKAQRRLTAALLQASNDFATASFAYSADPNGSTQGKTNLQRYNEASAALNGLSKIVLQPPYVPKLKQLRIDYTAKVEIPLGTWVPDLRRKEYLYHQKPFGYQALPIGIGSPQPLFPGFQAEGTVLIGFQGSMPGQAISLLLKIQPGSGNPEVQPPSITWWYHAQSGWRQLPEYSIWNDETNGLTQTGLLQLTLPADATPAATEMPSFLHWLVASVERDCEDLPDWEDLHIHAQRAMQISEATTWSFPKGSIKGLEGVHPAVGKVTQPYATQHGKPAETQADFYLRVSERLRHKNRAVTAWDFEHLCMQQFPSLYAVKALQATAAENRQPGDMTLVVVPDLRSQPFANPFQPKFGFGELNEISAFMRRHAPPSARIATHNPNYRPVMVGTTINFKEGTSSVTGKYLIQQRLKAFLAPWAYEDATSMAFGGRLYVSEVVDVLQAEPYVDFVGKTRLFVGGGPDGKYAEAQAPDGDSSAYIEVADTDVLTSAETHLINEIGDEDAQNEIWEGISWMVIKQDFKVAEDPNVETEVFDEWLGISWMVIGKDFKVTEPHA